MSIPSDIIARAAEIKLLILDADGVLTDGGLYIGDDGQQYTRFHIRDGYGLVSLLKTGVQVAVISGRSSAGLRQRLTLLGVNAIYQGYDDKDRALHEIINHTGLAAAQLCYVGDDVPDLAVLEQVGLAVGVADAHERVKQAVHWQTESRGGYGAVREVCELIIAARKAP